MEAKNWIKRGSLFGLMVVALFWATSGVSLAQEEEIIAGGKHEYQRYCATCHGTEGKGDGPSVSILKVKPADLTQLSKKYEGQFPFWRVYQVIDGRQVVSGHGTSEMPIWGDQFRMQEAGSGAEALTRGRILQLVYYLQSIQEK